MKTLVTACQNKESRNHRSTEGRLASRTEDLSASSGRGGLADRWEPLRALSRAAGYVKDAGAISPSPRIVNCVQCAEVHSGLCVSGDADIYDKCLDAAKALERYFAADHKGEFFEIFGFEGPGGPIVHSAVVYFAHKRTRRQQVQLTRVFCVVRADDSNDLLFTERDCGVLDFVTPWRLVKAWWLECTCHMPQLRS